MVALNVVNAVCRDLFGIVITGVDEVLVFMMIWLVMLGMMLVTAEPQQYCARFSCQPARTTLPHGARDHPA